MITLFTPSPWLINENDLIIYTKKHNGYEENQPAICKVEQTNLQDNHGLGIPEIQAIANAKLIAAAPDLLDCLQSIEATLQQMRRDETVNGMLYAANTAIKKAIG